MILLDNSAGAGLIIQAFSRNALIFASILLIVLGVPSCRKARTDAPASAENRSTSASIADADALYSQRTDLIKVRQALIALRQGMAANPVDYDSAWRLAKFNYYLGAHTTDRDEQDKAYHDGIEAGKLAVTLNDSRPEGHFWLGANYGGNAEISVLAGLTDIEDIKHEMEAVIKVDPEFEGGSAYMALGQVYMKAPKIFGGDLEKAIDYLEQGIKIGPNNGLLRVRLAQAYAAAHRNAEAQKQIDALMAMKPIPGYEPEYNDAVKEAKELQEKIKQ
jgi:tetratricopeptide (TPR) repeat protein